MSRKSFDPKNCIAALNNIKTGIQMTGKPVTKQYLLDSFKNCGLPNNSVFWSVFKNSGLLQEVKKGLFTFTSKEPIYIERLINLQRKYLQTRKQYRKEPEKAEVVESVIKSPVQSAIDLLKSQGYQVLAPIGVVYKML